MMSNPMTVTDIRANEKYIVRHDWDMQWLTEELRQSVIFRLKSAAVPLQQCVRYISGQRGVDSSP